jgi:hypothetical protein
MPTTIDVIRDPVPRSAPARPFAFIGEAVDAVRLPETTLTGEIDRRFGSRAKTASVIGGFNYSEERTDLARRVGGAQAMRRAGNDVSAALTDASSLRAAVIRDGASDGDYSVPDGAAFNTNTTVGQEFAVLRLTVPVNFERRSLRGDDHARTNRSFDEDGVREVRHELVGRGRERHQGNLFRRRCGPALKPARSTDNAFNQAFSARRPRHDRSADAVAHRPRSLRRSAVHLGSARDGLPGGRDDSRRPPPARRPRGRISSTWPTRSTASA